MVLLKQAEDVIFSEGATTDGQTDTGVETRRKLELIDSNLEDNTDLFSYYEINPLKKQRRSSQ